MKTKRINKAVIQFTCVLLQFVFHPLWYFLLAFNFIVDIFQKDWIGILMVINGIFVIYKRKAIINQLKREAEILE